MNPYDGTSPGDLGETERLELIGAYLDGELSADEARVVTHWLDGNPEVLRVVEHMRRTDDLLDRYADEAVPEDFAQRVFSAVGIGESSRGAAPAWRRQSLWMLAAAAVVLVAIGAALFAMSGGDTPTNDGIDAAQRNTQMLNAVPDELVEHMDLLADFGSDDFEAALIDYADFDSTGQDG